MGALKPSLGHDLSLGRILALEAREVERQFVAGFEVHAADIIRRDGRPAGTHIAPRLPLMKIGEDDLQLRRRENVQWHRRRFRNYFQAPGSARTRK